LSFLIVRVELAGKKVSGLGVEIMDRAANQSSGKTFNISADVVVLAAGGLSMASPHPEGGCRMGESAQSSVVKSDHQVHGWEKLFVSDSSVFPSSSSLDPGLSIMVFSYIAAKRIKERFAV